MYFVLPDVAAAEQTTNECCGGVSLQSSFLREDYSPT